MKVDWGDQLTHRRLKYRDFHEAYANARVLGAQTLIDEGLKYLTLPEQIGKQSGRPSN